MSADWHVGQKVVCVSDTWQRPFKRSYFGAWLKLLGQPCPRKGDVYTIASIDADPYGQVGIFFVLRELPESLCESVGFRPVVEHKNDISIFTKILDRVNAKSPALS
ncbi:MAG: hypothetical protein P4L76_17915 [Beijerinckiaceae bacterium]|nr:hypothetical protein [Beijerinckiaceae bacterium]